MSQPKGFQDKVSLIWAVADILRGDFKPHEYGQVILPFVVLRRLECALEKNKDKVILKSKSLAGKINDLEAILNKESGHNFYNTSPLSLGKILQDPDKVSTNLNSYIRAFSPSASEVLDKYGFPEKIKKLEEQGLLYQVIGKFADIDLTETAVSNEAMGYIFEELLRKFSEMSNETAGEHYTPREVIRLMVNLLFIEDSKALAGQKPIRSIYDPACGTGGMLSVAEEYLHDINPNITLNVFGQELNPETWAIARSDLMIKGQDPTRISLGNSLTDEDGHSGKQFDYLISNPPYGVDWKKYSETIQAEHEKLGFSGRYGAGLPRVSDGSFLFLQHMVNKMKPVTPGKAANPNEGGSRMAIIFSGSPAFSGAAESGESNIRKWIIENDLLEGIVAMPDQMFYNTPIGTFIWVITNRKNTRLKDQIRFVDARDFGTKIKKNLGLKNKELNENAISEISRLYTEPIDPNKTEIVRNMSKDKMAYLRITIEQPLRCTWVIEEENLDDLDKKLQILLSDFIGKKFESADLLKSALIGIGVERKQATKLVKDSIRRDANGSIARGKKDEVLPDPDLREEEILAIPDGFLDLSEADQEKQKIKLAEDFLKTSYLPLYPEAWIDHGKSKLGFEIPFLREFYHYKKPLGTSQVIEEMKAIESQIFELLNPGGSKK
jgi:type I restriction enzyme M protein